MLSIRLWGQFVESRWRIVTAVWEALRGHDKDGKGQNRKWLRGTGKSRPLEPKDWNVNKRGQVVRIITVRYTQRALGRG